MAGFFFNDEFATPDAIDRRRALINALSKENLSTAPVGHWTAGLARVLGAAADGYEGAKLNEAEKKGVEANKAALMAAFGMGGSPTQLPGAAPADPAGSSWNGSGQQVPSVSRETAPPAPVQQQPLLPNRPQMPEGPNIFERVGGMIPEAMGQEPAKPSPFGTINQSISTNGNSAPLWTQPGLTKGVPGIGTMPTSPTLAFQEPGPMAPMGGGTQMAGGGTGGIYGRMLTQESGNRQFNRDGSVVTSPKGAAGIAQVMPATGPEAARLAGLPWDINRFYNDENYNKALGKAYFDAQNRKFNDPIAAAAAYNAGPGRVNQAIAQQERTGQPYTDFLPKETQNYIAAVGGPDMPAQGAQAAEQPMQRPAPGQFVNPMQGGGQMQRPGVNPALLQALASPWAAKNPMLAQLGMKVAGEQIGGTKLQYQTLPDGTILALDPSGRMAPRPVYQAPTKPTYGVIGKDEFGNEQYGWIDPVNRQTTPGQPTQAPATGGGGATNNQPGISVAPAQGIPPAPPGVDPKVWRTEQTKKLAEGDAGDKKFRETMGKEQGEYFVATGKDGDAAAQDLQTIGELRKLGDRIKTGGGAVIRQRLGEFGIKFKGSDDIEAYSALLNRLTPQQRVPGSGATSDFDAKMFRDSLPRLINTPEGNKLVLDTMERLAQNRMARADIANKVQTGELNRQEGMKQLSQLQSDARKLSEGIKTAAAKPAASPNVPGQTQTITREQYQSLPSGSKFIAADDPTKTVRTKP